LCAGLPTLSRGTYFIEGYVGAAGLVFPCT
jgi:hypothetical protein